ncbi:MAG TPA: YIP1 family protein [Dehalococcoidia bacterium]|nr:YIP1 family protein [Dehalococcoidia bacterium]
MDTQVIIDRLQRFLLKLDTSVFEEMRDDATATIPALIVAVVSFLLFGLGGWFWWLAEGYGDGGKLFWQSVLLGSVFAIALWAVWIGIAYVLLVNLFHYTADVQRMFRACSFATIPLILGLLLFIPGINIGIGLAVLGIFFLLMDIGIQVSVDAQPGHVIVSTFIGFLVFCLVLSLLVSRDNWLAPGVFLFRGPATITSDLANAFNAVPRNFQIPTVTTR